MHTELIKHQIAAYQEREAAQRADALDYAAMDEPEAARMLTEAADWTALKIAELQRRLATQRAQQAKPRTLDDVLTEAHAALQASALTWAA